MEAIGFGFHTLEGTPYWNESAFYQISTEEASVIQKASESLYELCLKAVDHVISKGLWDKFGIEGSQQDLIRNSFKRSDFSIYGRFDLGWNGHLGQPPKMLEFNADTPTSLFEAGVVQWDWLQTVFPKMDQLNRLHEALINTWKNYLPKIGNHTLYFGVLEDSQEDFTTVHYLRDCANQAGIRTEMIDMRKVGWNGRFFSDERERKIEHIFKLYPWEWLFQEDFGKHLNHSTTEWIEPPWKFLLSAKAILPILWELFPNHPNLLPAYFDSANGMKNFVRKPVFSREGANIDLFEGGQLRAATGGIYGGEGFVYQELTELYWEKEQNLFAVLGSWVVGGKSVGLGIREGCSKITDNFSQFVPHVIGEEDFLDYL